MNISPPPDEGPFYYSNRMGRIILLALEEVIGRIGVNAVLNLAGLQDRIGNLPPNNLDLAFPFEEVGLIQDSLERLYGPRGGRGLALRTGWTCFKYGLREFGPMLGISDLAFRLLPLTMKVKVGAEVFADTFNKYSDQIVSVEEADEQFYWQIERCPVCWGRETEQPCCHLAVGVLQESLFWVSGGKNFMVEETSCIAAGGTTCTIEIARSPIDG